MCRKHLRTREMSSEREREIDRQGQCLAKSRVSSEVHTTPSGHPTCILSTCLPLRPCPHGGDLTNRTGRPTQPTYRQTPPSKGWMGTHFGASWGGTPDSYPEQSKAKERSIGWAGRPGILTDPHAREREIERCRLDVCWGIIELRARRRPLQPPHEGRTTSLLGATGVGLRGQRGWALIPLASKESRERERETGHLLPAFLDWLRLLERNGRAGKESVETRTAGRSGRYVRVQQRLREDPEGLQ